MPPCTDSAIDVLPRRSRCSVTVASASEAGGAEVGAKHYNGFRNRRELLLMVAGFPCCSVFPQAPTALPFPGASS